MKRGATRFIDAAGSEHYRGRAFVSAGLRRSGLTPVRSAMVAACVASIAAPARIQLGV
jgi:hypothetical protein